MTIISWFVTDNNNFCSSLISLLLSGCYPHIITPACSSTFASSNHLSRFFSQLINMYFQWPLFDVFKINAVCKLMCGFHIWINTGPYWNIYFESHISFYLKWIPNCSLICGSHLHPICKSICLSNWYNTIYNCTKT